MSHPRLGARKPINCRLPLVCEAFRRLDALPNTIDTYCVDAGIDRWSLTKWRTGEHDPRLASFEAFVTALGGRLTIEWKELP